MTEEVATPAPSAFDFMRLSQSARATHLLSLNQAQRIELVASFRAVLPKYPPTISELHTDGHTELVDMGIGGKYSSGGCPPEKWGFYSSSCGEVLRHDLSERQKLECVWCMMLSNGQNKFLLFMRKYAARDIRNRTFTNMVSEFIEWQYQHDLAVGKVCANKNGVPFPVCGGSWARFDRNASWLGAATSKKHETGIKAFERALAAHRSGDFAGMLDALTGRNSPHGLGAFNSRAFAVVAVMLGLSDKHELAGQQGHLLGQPDLGPTKLAEAMRIDVNTLVAELCVFTGLCETTAENLCCEAWRLLQDTTKREYYFQGHLPLWISNEGSGAAFRLSILTDGPWSAPNWRRGSLTSSPHLGLTLRAQREKPAVMPLASECR